jgi:uncharacterized protein YjbJ (UPF0337 family)
LAAHIAVLRAVTSVVANGAAVSIRSKVDKKAKKIKGNVKESAGHALHDDDLIVAGKAEQVSSDLKEAGKKVRDAAKSVH